MTEGAVTRTAATEGSASLIIPVAPSFLWPIVSDPTGMGRFSPENSGAKWRHGSTRAEVGARFRGLNRRGPLIWFTECVVTVCERNKMFAFDVTFPPVMPLIATWTWTLEPAGAPASKNSAARVTLSWELPRKLEAPRQWMWNALRVGDRPSDLTAGSARTLRAISDFVTS